MENSPSEKRVAWSEEAKDSMLDVYEAAERALGYEGARAFVDRIFERAEGLGKFPDMGSIDFEKSNRLITVRYLVESVYKIYYSHEKTFNYVLIRGVYDSRRELSTFKKR